VNASQTSVGAPTRLEAGLFALVAGLGAFLLFDVQLVLGKRLLPWFGGTSAVWTTCLLFFQAALLGGYGWAHLLAGRFARRRQGRLHLLLLASALLLLAGQGVVWPSPITPGDAARPLASEAPAPAILVVLASAVGLPFVVLAATSPLLQAWLVRRWPGASPFWLFALSNAGSLLGLVSYPLVVEPLVSIRTQGWLWFAGFDVYAVGLFSCAATAGRASADRPSTDRPSTDGPGAQSVEVGRHLLWLALAAFPSVMLLAVTSHLTQEVAAVPLLWVLPLAMYLLSFILCFGWPRTASRVVWGPGLTVAAAVAVFGLYRATDLRVPAQVSLWAIVLFVYGMAGHGELVRLRPGPRHLTSYYLTIAAGGALGGVLNAVVAPVLFRGYWELHLGLLGGPIVVVVALLADPGSPLRGGPPERLFVSRVAAATALVALAIALGAHATGELRGALIARRGFYGVLRVVRERQGEADECLKLLHGRIAHGLQLADPRRRQETTTYFGPSSGVGLAIGRHPKRLAGQPMRVGVVGLGVGTIAAWSEPGDAFRFYELDPEVARLSQGPSPVFTYLRDAPGAVSVVLGDGRLALEQEPPQAFDVLVLDAFSSDAIPAHLLTREAFALYARHLGEGGIIAVQITNRYVDLKPVLRTVAADQGLVAMHIPSYERGVRWGSDWVLVALDPGPLRDEVIDAASLPALGRPERVVWTDDWSDLLRVLKR
jgi:hypothetical protein